MKALFDYITNNLLTQPILLIGILIAAGYIAGKKGYIKVITGSITAMVGMSLILFGGNQFSVIFKPITQAVADKIGIKGYIMDSYAMRAATQEALGNKFGLVAYVFLIAFAVNILLVYFGKYTKAKGIFLTGNAGIAHAQSVLWLVIVWLGTSNIVSTIITGIMLGIYWAYSTTLAYKTIEKATDGAGFTIGHNIQFGIWFFGKIAPFFGKPEEDDAENLQLPGFLKIFNNNIVSTCLLMLFFSSVMMIPLGIEGIQTLAGKTHWLNYIFEIGINFSVAMVILLNGVRLMVGELTEAFTGIQEKIIPNAVPAIDVPALLPFSPTAATLGFIFTTVGTILSMVVLLVCKSPIMVIPGFVPLFFAGGPIGVITNKLGGYKATIVCCILLGMIQSFGSVWAITLMGIPDGIGWSGMFDFSTVWPLITEGFKFIGKLIGM